MTPGLGELAWVIVALGWVAGQLPLRYGPRCPFHVHLSITLACTTLGLIPALLLIALVQR